MKDAARLVVVMRRARYGNQYDSTRVQKMIQPILGGTALSGGMPCTRTW